VTEPDASVVAIGSRVRIRSIRPPEPRHLPFPLSGENNPECVVTIVEPADTGLYRLSTRTPLGRALLGRRVGDVVAVQVGAREAGFEVLAGEVVG
jgi:transcription elongation GreA/GreB family factor